MSTTCTQCRQTFTVTPEDMAFYDKVSPEFGGKKYAIPPPTLCPSCRWQRRLCFRNERTLYHRKCDLSGKSMISMHPADTPFQVFHITEWMSDAWDPKEYGRPMDFDRPFFQQFQELCNEVPHFSAFVDPSMDINSEYTNCSSEAKNCYLITQAEKNEDCYYSRGINTCKNCCDCLRVHHCELCYEAVSCRNCYRCLFVEDCDNCNDCIFSTDLRGCKNCFGCHGLVQKEYHIFNQPVSKEEWEVKVGSLKLTHAILDQMRIQSAATGLTIPKRASRIIQCENSTGDDLLECRDCRECFDCNKLENCAYCNEVANDAKDCMDFAMFGLNCELVYESGGGGYNMYNVLFSHHCWNNVSNLLYCESCFPSVKDCFGCFGLKHAQYCILNKQYTKEEYETLVPEIIKHMGETPLRLPDGSFAGQEWGEFFHPSISAYGYNETIAQDFFPLTKEEVMKREWNWRDEAATSDNYLGPEISVPETIDKISDDITDKILRCEKTNRPYRITAQELAFYRNLGLPVPKLSPQERHAERMRMRRPRTLWDRTCTKCSKEIQTTYAPNRPEIVYCEECYLTSVY